MDIVNKRIWFFFIAILIIVVGIVSLATFGIKSGIEFSSGSVMTIGFDKPVNQNDLRQELNNLGYSSTLIQTTGQGDYILRLPEMTTTQKNELQSALTKDLGSFQVREFDSISPMIASETTRNAGIAVGIAAIAMLLYIAFAFRRMPNPFRFGICAIGGLLFDIFVVLTIFSLFGGIFGWEINLMFITGVLAVIGYSINNTIIVFDRIRENVRKGVSSVFGVAVNTSLVETLGRNFNTSLTTLFAAFALLFFVGASIQNFVVVLITGVISGTFSSICLSPLLLVAWDKRKWGSFSSREAEAPLSVSKVRG